MGGFDSISSLLRQGNNSVSGKLAAKEKEISIKKQEETATQLAGQVGLGYVNLFGFPISPEAIAIIPEAKARQAHAVCFYFDGENIRIGALDPGSQLVQEIIAEVSSRFLANTKLFVITQNSFDYAFEVYGKLPKVKAALGGVAINPEELARFQSEVRDFHSLKDKVNSVSVSDIFTLILAAAIKINASDIHVEAEDADIVIRFRIDGVLQETARIEKDKWKKIISRLKLMAGVKLNVESEPQDGRFSIFLTGDHLDVRVSFLPTAFGESVVMRLLRSSTANVSFDGLGLRPEFYKILATEIAKPNGLILTTGPTGSGKTTTLYAILNKLNDAETKIITLEDPIEYQLKGISQSQINEKKGYTFATGLRSILRQDPNIVMVGEIRDLETAEIAIQASLTGHLVLSTLHTNDAAGVIPRLLDMGVKAFFLAPAINIVIGQRLVRKLCPFCKQEQVLKPEEKAQVEKIIKVLSPQSQIKAPLEIPKIYQVGKGCEKCAGLGYRDRVGIYEIFKPNDQIKDMTLKNAPDFQILTAAIDSGMITMLQDGVLKVFEGITDLAEVYRVAGDFDYINELYKQRFGKG